MAVNYQNKIVTNGLVLCLDAADKKSYPGSGTVWADRSGRGNNGTLTNGPTFSSANGGSIVFDGTNDYINCGTTLGNFGTSNFTINFFFKTSTSLFPRTFISKSIGDSPTIDYGWLIDNGSNSSNLGFAIATANGSWGISGSYSTQTLGATINNGIWQMATLVADRSQANVNIYLNSTNQSLQSYAGGSSFSTVGNVNNDKILSIGSESDIAVSPFHISSNISQVQIYNRALTPQEITQNFNATRGRFAI